MRTWWILQRQTWLWWGLALVLKAPLFWVLLQEHGFHHSLYGWGVEGGDTFSYFTPIDSLLTGNGYQPDLRMPGYGALYLLLRVFTTEPGAGVVILFLQPVLAALACAALAHMAHLVGLSRKWCLAVLIASATAPILTFTDVWLATESFCMSALILGLHQWFAHRTTGSTIALFTSGSWLTWAVFLRPVCAVVLGLVALSYLLRRDTGLRQRITQMLLFIAPFLVLDGAWTLRNWRVHQAFHPLANSLYYPEFKEAPTYALFNYLQAYGGAQAWWDPQADIRWFNVREGENARPGRLIDDDVEPPWFAFSERCTRDSLQALAADMKAWSEQPRGSEEARRINERATARADRLTAMFKEDRPFVHHVTARLRLLWLQLKRSGFVPLFETHFRGDPPFAPIIEWYDKLWYWTLMPLGLLGAALTLGRWSHPSTELRWLAGVVIAFSLVHPFVFRVCEGRYLIPLLPLLLLFAVIAARNLSRSRA